MEPSITLPLQFATEAEIQDASDWSEYCNGGVETKMGALRASRGHPEPFDVQLWTLGNELNLQVRYHNYPNDTSHVSKPSGAEYASIASKAARAVAANPPSKGSLQLVVIANDQPSWDGPTIASLPYVDHRQHNITYHMSWHNAGYVEQGNPSQPQDFTKLAKVGGSKLVDSMRGLRTRIDQYAKEAGFDQIMSISADEWGLGSPWKVAGFGSVHAMFAAALLGSVVRNAEALGVAFTNYFEVINEGGIKVYPFTSELTPVGEALALYAKHQSHAQVPVTPASAEGGDIDILASIVDNNNIQLTIANVNAEVSHEVKVVLKGDIAAMSASAVLLTAETPLTLKSGFDRTSIADVPVEAGVLTIHLPAFAIAHVTVPLTKHAIAV